MSQIISQFGFVIFIGLIMLAIGLLQIFLLWAFNRPWWKTKWIRRTSLLLPVVGALAMLAWRFGGRGDYEWLGLAGMLLGTAVIVCELALLLALPISGIFHLINKGFDTFLPKREQTTRVDTGRRRVLQGLAAAAPLIALSSGTGGLARSFGPVRVYRRELSVVDLPAELEGFKILHLSDMHLRHYTTLETLESVMLRAKEHEPHLILVTGDIADDLEQLPGALQMIEQFGAPYGYYASLGNHEYFRGVDAVKRVFDRFSVPLFINHGERLTVGSTPVFVAGIDDPRRMGAKDYAFYQQTIDRAVYNKRKGDFVILMSHRPDALDYASEKNIPVTLAGHTHGGQIGLGGRSLFESYWEDRYLWGEYRKGRSTLYTSSGVGHWFPFRLGCPPEAPIIELHRDMAAN